MFATTTLALKAEKKLANTNVIDCTTIFGNPMRTCMALEIIMFKPVSLLATAKAKPPPASKPRVDTRETWEVNGDSNDLRLQHD